jgi:hypothetical protein
MPAWQLETLSPSGDLQRYRLSGSITLAGMLALEQAIADLPGVSYAMVSPAPEGGSATLLVRAEDARGTIRAISNLPMFNIEAGQP